MEIALPDSIPLADLLATHPEYNPAVSTPSGANIGELRKHRDLYEGGQSFHENKIKYLRARMQDKNPDYLRARLGCAYYGRETTQLINWLAGDIFKAEPGIEETGDPYWDGLNDDADGGGKDLAALLHDVLISIMVYRRGFLAVTFPGQGGDTLADSKKAGGKADGKIGSYCAEDVDDWSDDDLGNPEWVRIHKVMQIRTGTAQAEKERHTWTYISTKGQRSYSADKEIGKDWPDKKAFVAADSDVKTFNYDGKLPVIRVEIPKGLWVSDLLADMQLALFNAQAGVTFSHENNCYQFLALTGDTKPATLDLSELNALWLGLGGGANYVSPSGTPFEQLKSYATGIKDALFLAVQAMLLQAASKDEHGRQSGVAKQRDMEPARVLLSCYRGRMRDALEKALDIIKFIRREEDLELPLKGLEHEDKPEEPVDPENPQADPATSNPKDKALGFKPKPEAA